MNIQYLKHDLHNLREEWRDIRDKKLRRKEELLYIGTDKNDLRRDRAYKELKRGQQQLSNRIKHIEKKLNRKIAAIDPSK
ncbi:MAG: hypothetical protein SVR08_17310 [Spirochaetota bacterium]|nr:hypothetical protein [Spirochaetota bacterium]